MLMIITCVGCRVYFPCTLFFRLLPQLLDAPNSIVTRVAIGGVEGTEATILEGKFSLVKLDT